MMITDSRDVGRASRTGCLGALQATGKHPHVAHSGEELTRPRFRLAANAFSRAFRPGVLCPLRQGKPSQPSAASESQLEPHARCELSDRDLRWSVTGSTPLVRTSGSFRPPTMRFLLFRCVFTIAMPRCTRRLSPSLSRLCRASGPAALAKVQGRLSERQETCRRTAPCAARLASLRKSRALCLGSTQNSFYFKNVGKLHSTIISSF